MAGYSKTPLYKKLGIKPGFVIYVKNAPHNYLDLITPIASQIQFRKRLTKSLDLVHFFTRSEKELTNYLPKLKHTIKVNGSIWISWPKKTSQVPTNVTENTIRKLCLPMGLVDIKVCAVDETWSGLKLVIRKELREKSI